MTKPYDFGAIASWVCDPTRGAGELDAVLREMKTEDIERELRVGPGPRWPRLVVDNTGEKP